jgi:hypothetical protein
MSERRDLRYAEACAVERLAKRLDGALRLAAPALLEGRVDRDALLEGVAAAREATAALERSIAVLEAMVSRE